MLFGGSQTYKNQHLHLLTADVVVDFIVFFLRGFYIKPQISKFQILPNDTELGHDLRSNQLLFCSSSRIFSS